MGENKTTIDVYQIKHEDELQYIEYNTKRLYITFYTMDIFRNWLRRINIYLTNFVVFYGIMVKDMYEQSNGIYITIIKKFLPICIIDNKYDNDHNLNRWYINTNIGGVNIIYELINAMESITIESVNFWVNENIFNIFNSKYNYTERISRYDNVKNVKILDHASEDFAFVNDNLVDYIKSLMIKRKYKELRNLNMLKNGILIWTDFFNGYCKENYYSCNLDVVEILNLMDEIVLRQCLEDLKIIQKYSINWSN